MKNGGGRGAILAAGLVALAGAGHAASLADAVEQGKPVVDLRARYESNDDKSKPLHGDAATLRARLGYETGVWNGLSLAFDVDGVVPLGVGSYNSTRNGKTAYPTIADPTLIALNRFQLTYATNFDTKIVVGRQRLQFGDQRFIGNSGWRQHEQTFDALMATNTSLKDLTLTYAYVIGVNRVYGPDDPKPVTGPAGRFDSDSHLFNAAYAGVPGLKLEGFLYLLDLSQKGPAPAVLATSKLSTATYGARAEYRAILAEGVVAQLNGAAAHQEDYAGNPMAIGLDYWLAEGSLSYKGFTAAGGYEAMSGNGSVGFSTPLASLHPFDGWADMFTTTPVNGIDDLYVKAAYSLPGFLSMKSLTATVIHHDFAADRTSVAIGGEWDASLELNVDQRLSFLAAVAAYQGGGIGQGGFAGKSVAWLQATFKY